MHGRIRLVISALVMACWLPSTAAAAAMPAGTYDVTIQNGTVKLGSLTGLSLNSGTKFTVPVTDQKVAQPIGLTLPDTPITGPVTGTASVTVTGAGITIDPADGSASVDASFFITVVAGGLGSCSLGSSGSPISVHLTTADGSPWDAATGSFTMTDKTFTLPAPSCSPSLLAAPLALVLGSTQTAGDNLITIVGTAVRLGDTVVNPSPSTQPGGGGSTPAPTAGNPDEFTPLVAPAARNCVVPKLVGKTLKQAKRALKKAGCKAGKTKKQNSKRRKKGRVVKQRYKAGKKLPAGAKVPLTISKGPKHARRHRSR